MVLMLSMSERLIFYNRILFNNNTNDICKNINPFIVEII